MSLARNPNAPYAAAGMQPQHFERMKVRSHVSVPNAEASADSDGRRSYSAPANAGSKHEGIPFLRALLLWGMVFFVICILFLCQASKLSTLSKQRQAIIDNMRQTRLAITELTVQVARAQDSSTICYQAVQNLGMVTSKGVETIEIYAPDTRPSAAGISLSAPDTIAALNNGK